MEHTVNLWGNTLVGHNFCQEKGLYHSLAGVPFIARELLRDNSSITIDCNVFSWVGADTLGKLAATLITEYSSKKSILLSSTEHRTSTYVHCENIEYMRYKFGACCFQDSLVPMKGSWHHIAYLDLLPKIKASDYKGLHGIKSCSLLNKLPFKEKKTMWVLRNLTEMHYVFCQASALDLLSPNNSVTHEGLILAEKSDATVIICTEVGFHIIFRDSYDELCHYRDLRFETIPFFGVLPEPASLVAANFIKIKLETEALIPDIEALISAYKKTISTIKNNKLWVLGVE